MSIYIERFIKRIAEENKKTESKKENIEEGFLKDVNTARRKTSYRRGEYGKRSTESLPDAVLGGFFKGAGWGAAAGGALGSYMHATGHNTTGASGPDFVQAGMVGGAGAGALIGAPIGLVRHIKNRIKQTSRYYKEMKGPKSPEASDLIGKAFEKPDTKAAGEKLGRKWHEIGKARANYKIKFGHEAPEGLRDDHEAMNRWINGPGKKAPAPEGSYGPKGSLADKSGSGDAHAWSKEQKRAGTILKAKSKKPANDNY